MKKIIILILGLIISSCKTDSLVNSPYFSEPLTIRYIQEWDQYLEFSASSDFGRMPLSFSNDNKYIASGYLGTIYSLSDKKLLRSLSQAYEFACDFGNDNVLLLGNQLFNITDGSLITNYEIPYMVLGGKISKNGLLVGLYASDTYGGNSACRIFRIDGTIISNYDHRGYFLNFSNSSDKFIYASHGYLYIVNLLNDSTIATKKINDLSIYDAVFSPDDNLIAVASYQNKVRIWDYKNDIIRELETATSHYAYIKTIEFTPDGNYIVCGRNSTNVSLWDVKTGEYIQSITDYNGINYGGTVYDIDVSPSGEYIASYGAGQVRVHKKNGGWEIYESK